MKKSICNLAMFLLLVYLAACGPSLKVSSDYDRTADFARYKTFSLYKSDSFPGAISQLNQNRIVSAIRNEMIKKGYSETTGNPNLLVNPVAIVKDKVAVSSNTNYYGYGGFYRPYYWGAGSGFSSSTNYNVEHYKDGSLVIDLIDAATRKLIWQGVGNSEIDKPLKDPDTQIPKAIQQILAAFPPGANKKS